MDFYSRFEQLCNDRGVTPTQAARDNGISQPAVAMWKKRNSTPQANTVQKLADYFGVSVDCLLNGEGKAPIPKDDCSSDIADFYSIFERLCHEKDITPARVRKDLQISQSTMASWKSRGLTPKAGTLQELADYFGVSVPYLLGQDTEKAPTPKPDGRPSDDDIKFALFGGDKEITDEMFEEVKRFAEFIKNK